MDGIWWKFGYSCSVTFLTFSASHCHWIIVHYRTVLAIMSPSTQFLWFYKLRPHDLDCAICLICRFGVLIEQISWGVISCWSDHRQTCLSRVQHTRHFVLFSSGLCGLPADAILCPVAEKWHWERPLESPLSIMSLVYCIQTWQAFSWLCLWLGQHDSTVKSCLYSSMCHVCHCGPTPQNGHARTEEIQCVRSNLKVAYQKADLKLNVHC